MPRQALQERDLCAANGYQIRILPCAPASSGDDNAHYSDAARTYLPCLHFISAAWLTAQLPDPDMAGSPPVPFGKWILLVLAVSPMALFQAATITPDAISNGIGFLFIAGCLRMSTGSESIGWRDWDSLVLLVFLLFLAKLNLIPLILLPFLLILPSQFTRKKTLCFPACHHSCSLSS